MLRKAIARLLRTSARWLPSGDLRPPEPASRLSRSSSTEVRETEADGSSVTFDGQALLIAPIYAAEGSTSCWKCHRRTSVVALASELVEIDGERIQELVLASNVRKLPPDLASILSKIYPRYRAAHSHTAGGRYYMNRCSACDAKLGDFFLHEELGGAFFPADARAAALVTLSRLPVSSPSEIAAAFSVSSPNLFHEHVRRPPV
jgi:hypothetical protein